ncbi:hypothetical protein T4D_3811 [Trichinella pseudospiralis]|uniref:Uncharacterized protein n=1 Tax=Trichinella pseudospiralis TaxID=6337 RepID=A0A0V1FUI5_TRIPS|nr:hypothetical protein T4D_3811 [Trichinella pseudospiralis]
MRLSCQVGKLWKLRRCNACQSMYHGCQCFMPMHLDTADTTVDDNSRALLSLVSGIHATISSMAPFIP